MTVMTRQEFVDRFDSLLDSYHEELGHEPDGFSDVVNRVRNSRVYDNAIGRAYDDGVLGGSEMIGYMCSGTINERVEFVLIMVPATLMYLLGAIDAHDLDINLVKSESMKVMGGDVPPEAYQMQDILNHPVAENAAEAVRENPYTWATIEMCMALIKMDNRVLHYFFYTVPTFVGAMDFLIRCYYLGYAREKDVTLS